MMINILVWGIMLSVIAGILYRGFVDPKQPPSNQKATIAVADALKAAVSNHPEMIRKSPEVSGNDSSEEKKEE